MDGNQIVHIVFIKLLHRQCHSQVLIIDLVKHHRFVNKVFFFIPYANCQPVTKCYSVWSKEQSYHGNIVWPIIENFRCPKISAFNGRAFR